MSDSNDNVHQSFSLERLDDFRCHLDGIILDSSTPENTTGAFGDLFTGTHPTEGKLALKRPRGDLYNARAVAAIEIEASVWKRLRHPCILQFLGIHTIDDSVYFVSPYAENGSLPEFIQRRPDVDRKRLVVEIAEGVLYLHQCAIVHGDLKGNNILISKSEHVQICDFGLAKHVTSRTATSLRGAGSLPWQSPEMLQNAGKKTFKSDVYAFGITIYEVLSGKEPYSHHLGLFSLITGVVLGGERPPKDPSTGPDGSSYLQFWDEAEKCWDGEPTHRPSMLDVLRHLDPQRFEVLDTSQQVLLEKSLNVGAQEQTHFQVAMAMPPFNFDGESFEPMQLARQIQLRMQSLHNMRRPINRLLPKTLAWIILEASPVAPLHNTEAYIRTLTSWARLRTVCKAWCRALDNTPEFWRHIWVHRGGHNMAHLQKRNVTGPLRCLVTGWGTGSLLRDKTLQDILNRISELRSELSIHDMDRWRRAWFSSTHNGYSNLSSLTMSERGGDLPSISHPATLEFNGAHPTLVLDGLSLKTVDPGLFRWVQVLKMVNMFDSGSFVQDVCAFIFTARNITELHLQSIRTRDFLRFLGPTPHSALPETPKFLGKHSPLRVVSLVGLDSPIAIDLLYHLSSCPLKVLEVDKLEPACLMDSTGVGRAIAEELGSLSRIAEISLTVTVKGQAMHVNFAKFGGLIMGGSDEGWKLESGRIGFSMTHASDWMNLVSRLSALGIRALSDGVEFEPTMGWRYPLDLGHKKVLVVELSRAEEVFSELVVAAQKPLGPAQHPLLEQIILIDSDDLWSARALTDRALWRFVVLHQGKASEVASRITKLKRLGLPSEWIERINHDRRIWLESQGIEVCDTSDYEFVLTSGS